MLCVAKDTMYLVLWFSFRLMLPRYASAFLLSWHGMKYVRMRRISRYIQGAASAKEGCQAYDMPTLAFTFCTSALAQL